jgi:acetate kinase
LCAIGQRVVRGGSHYGAPTLMTDAVVADLGLHLDSKCNAAHAPIISTNASRVVVRVIPTDEDRIIPRHTHRLIEEGANHGNHI